MKRMRVAVCLASLAMASVPAVSQIEMQRRTSAIEQSIFFEVLSLKSNIEGKARLDVYVQMPYEEIRFLKDGDWFVGRYDLSLTMMEDGQKVVKDTSMAVEIRLREVVPSTANRRYNLRQIQFLADPGKYELHLTVSDQETRNTARLKRPVTVPDFWKDSLGISSLMLVTRFTRDGERMNIVPNISGAVTQQGEGFFLFGEVYRAAGTDSLRVTTTLWNAKNENVFRKDTIEPVAQERAELLSRVESGQLPVGLYVALLEVRDERLNLVAQSSKSFSIRWTDLPLSIANIDKAIDQLHYIARDADLQHIRDGAEEEERKQRFLEFWTKRDPDPSTKRNELMEEYYSRIEYVNQAFGHYIEGWRTDRGMVYIRFGPPENVERHPFEAGTRPYEVWYYYQFNREFLFVDESGFGDYRLRYPTTDLWGRIR